MKYFGTFFLDKEKDIIVDLYTDGEGMEYILSTPNHRTGNLITNLASLCSLPLSENAKGDLVIRGTVPSYIDGYNRKMYIFRLGGTKTANIFPDGTIEMKASIPAISKTLMSQTNDYHLGVEKTIIKSYILTENKFRADLHTHMNANLPPDILIALGIHHQIRYPLYYIRKLRLKCTPRQEEYLAQQRAETVRRVGDCGLTGKYYERRINDNTFINFADLILGNLDDRIYNIGKIRNSLAVMKDGQAVFTNLEKVYLYRYVFTKAARADYDYDLTGYEGIPDTDIVSSLRQMEKDRQDPAYAANTLFQDKLLWTARNYQKQGIRYAEISDTSLTKKDAAPRILEQIHRVMPAVTAGTGVTLRFLAALRRIPLTIVRDRVAPADYASRLRTVRAVACDPYVAGSDMVGEELNDIRELEPVLKELVRIAAGEPSFVIRIHAGENDSLRENVTNSILAVRNALAPGQEMPRMRIGHGLHTPSLRSEKGKQLISLLKETGAVLEFQISSNVRLNNLNNLKGHPLKTYLREGVKCVQGTDGGALYGTDSMDEQLSLEKLLSLTWDEMHAMRVCEEEIISDSLYAFGQKRDRLEGMMRGTSVESFYERRIREMETSEGLRPRGTEKADAATVLADMIREVPRDRIPIVVAGGSFNSDSHKTRMRSEGKALIDSLLDRCDPQKVCFVIGHRLTGYEKYLVDRNRGRFEIYAFVPSAVSGSEVRRYRKEDIFIRVSIEAAGMGTYKSVAYEIFKQRDSILLALDGNSPAVNMIQEANNAKYECRIFVDRRARVLRAKAESLQGYVTMIGSSGSDADRVMKSLKKLQGKTGQGK